jgi:hypothetical protein
MYLSTVWWGLPFPLAHTLLGLTKKEVSLLWYWNFPFSFHTLFLRLVNKRDLHKHTNIHTMINSKRSLLGVYVVYFKFLFSSSQFPFLSFPGVLEDFNFYSFSSCQERETGCLVPKENGMSLFSTHSRILSTLLFSCSASNS